MDQPSFVVSVLLCVGILLVTELLTELGVLPDTGATKTAEFERAKRQNGPARRLDGHRRRARAHPVGYPANGHEHAYAHLDATFTPTITQTPDPTTGVVSVSAGDYRLDISGAWEAAEAGDTKPRRGAFLILDVSLHNGGSKRACFYDRDFRAKVTARP